MKELRFRPGTSGLSYTCKILEITSFLQYKLSIDVEVCEKAGGGKLPNKEDLERFAKRLFSVHKGSKYDKVFICYYLPGMVKDAGAWATSHFTPDLQVRILGSLQDKETKTSE